jgi:amino acid transporter
LIIAHPAALRHDTRWKEQGLSIPHSAPTVSPGEETDRRLHRSASFIHLLFLALGTVIGSGWLFAVLAADSFAGPASIISWVLAGLFTILIALTYAEIAGMLPRTGGVVRYPHLSHGAYAGFLAAWGYLLGTLFVPAIEAIAVLTYLDGRFPQLGLAHTVAGTKTLTWPTGIAGGVLIMVLFLVLNAFGIRVLAEFNRWVMWWKLIIPTLTFLLLFAAFHGSNFTQYGGFAPLGVTPVLQALPLAGIVFAYNGYRNAVEFGGECRNPQRDVPLATILSVLITMALYTLIQVGFTGALDFGKAGIRPGAWTALEGSHWASGPLYSALSESGLPLLAAFATVLLIDAAVSPAGTGLVLLGGNTRNFYGLAAHGLFPRVFLSLNRFRIPWPALVVATVVGSLVLLPSPSWYKLIGLTTSAASMSLALTAVAVPVMRRTLPNLRRPFRLPAAGVLAPLAFICSMLVVYWVGFAKLLLVTVAIFAGLIVFVWVSAPNRGWIGRRAGAVIGLAFLVGLGLLSYAGSWMMMETPRPPGGIGFPAFFVLLAALIAGFTALLWWLSSPEGRLQTSRGWWLIALQLATLLLSYFGEYGPMKGHAPLPFPVSDLIMVGIALGAYYWGAVSGFATEDAREIAASSEVAGGPAPAAPIGE